MKKIVFAFAFIHCIFVFGYSQPQYNNFETSDNLEIVIAPGTDTLWQIGKPSKNYFDAAYSIPNAIMTDSLNTYPTGQSTWFEIELDDNTLWSWPYIQVEWFYKIDVEEGVDGGIIETSYDNGQTWNNLFSDPDFQPAVVGSYETDTLFNGQIGITGLTDWAWMAICWGSFTGNLPNNPSSIKVRYTFVSDSIDTQQAGWMMDDFITTEEIIGSTTNQDIQPIRVFPNPTTDALYFDRNELNLADINVHIYNNSGQLVVQQKMNTLVERNPFISTKQLPSGMYTVLIQSEEAVFRASFVKSE